MIRIIKHSLKVDHIPASCFTFHILNDSINNVQIAVEFFDTRPIEKRVKTEPEVYGANFLDSDSYMSCDFEDNKNEQIKTFGNMFLDLNSFDQYNNLIEKHVDLKNCIIEYKQKLSLPALDFKEDCEDC